MGYDIYLGDCEMFDEDDDDIVCEGMILVEESGKVLPCERDDNLVYVEGSGWLCPDHR